MQNKEQVKYGLIGYPLSHSFSKGYFSKKFQKENIKYTSYENFEIEEISQLEKVLKKYPLLKGLNVTIPYKEKVISYLDSLDSLAFRIGAVNTIKIEKSKLKGYNTDYWGVKKSLETHQIRGIKKALILGTGGASKAVREVLKDFNISFTFVTREKKENFKYPFYLYKELDEKILQSHSLIINTTPLGMFPKIEETPLKKYEGINNRHILFDLIYNPAKTQFLMEGERMGATIENGLKMLIYQAEESWKIWKNKRTPYK